MKIITLLPVKNEEWVLGFSLKNFELFSDEILLLDDHSTDTSGTIAAHFPTVTVIPYADSEVPVNMSKRRSLLLAEGRKRGGTHFVMLDADEILSEGIARTLRTKIASMRPGETLLLPWLFVHNQEGGLVYDTTQKTNYKDFIFCDDRTSSFSEKNLSEDRTPGDHSNMKLLPFEEGYVIHLQHISQKRNDFKQAWYRCNELLEGKKTARRINAIYNFTKAPIVKNTEPLRDAFWEKHKADVRIDTGYEWYMQAMLAMFDTKGILFFEPLDIWHIPELEQAFLEAVGRKPHPRVYPSWVMWVRDIKNFFKKKP